MSKVASRTGLNIKFLGAFDLPTRLHVILQSRLAGDKHHRAVIINQREHEYGKHVICDQVVADNVSALKILTERSCDQHKAHERP